MTQYVLHVSSFAGFVPWARHFKGRVEGPHPGPCHGNSTHHRGGSVFCPEGHELPKQVRWDVEADWSSERHERYLAACHKALRNDGQSPDGPSQFDTQQDVIDRAMVQFLDGLDKVNDPAEEGDELWYGWVNPGGEQFDEITDPEDGWGMMIARKCTE